MKKLLLPGIAVAALTLGGFAAPAAQAYDRASYAYAAGHMPAAKSIPKALGTYRANMFFGVDAVSTQINLCSPRSDDNLLAVKGARFEFSAGYASVARNATKGVNVNVWQFRNAPAAIKAFRTLEKEAKKCTGERTSTYTDDDGTAYTYGVTYANGKLSAVTVAGVQSVFIESDYRNASSDGTPDDTFDSYAVYTLVNDVIIGSFFSNNVEATISKAERAAMATFAFRNVDAWLG
jgi:hypothetical protein